MSWRGIVLVVLSALLAHTARSESSNKQAVLSLREVLLKRGPLAPDADHALIMSTVLNDTLRDDAWAWYLRGLQLYRAQRFEASDGILERTLGLMRSQGQEEDVALVLTSLGMVHSVRGVQAEAMDHLFEGMEILRRTGPVREEARAALTLAFIFRYQEDMVRAAEHYELALRLVSEVADPDIHVEALRGLAGIAGEQKELAAASSYYDQALRIARGAGLSAYPPYLKVDRSNVAIEQARYADAERDLKEALTYFEKEGNSIWVSYTLSRIAAVNLARGRSATAIELAERGLVLAQEKGLLKESLDNLFILPEAYASMGRWQEAFDHSLAFESMHDTMRNDAMATELARMDLRQQQIRDSLMRAEKQQAERLLFDADLTRARTQRNIVLFVGSGVLLLVGGLWSRLRHTRRVGRELAEGNALIQMEVARAERSEKVKEQFLANMSHEIRTPMNAIMGMTSNLRRNEYLPEQERYLDAIAQSSNNLLVILNDILDLGKLEAGTVELEKVPMEPRAVIGNVMDILRFKAEEKGLTLNMRIHDDAPAQVLGDPARLNQILLNLVGNAIKFTEKGGVDIELRAERLGEERVVLSYLVRDTGIGIRPERIEKIFEEFTQAYSDTTRKYGGTGLGLTITKRLIELQGGTVRVESVPEHGSTFIVQLPTTVLKEIGPSSSEETSQRDLRLEGIRILLAEDNAFNVMVAQDELNDAIPGVEVVVAENGRVAVEKVTSGGFDLVLMDIQMPEMNGFDATRAIRALPGAIGRVPIVAMTANVLKSEVAKSKEAGMNGFVPKPFQREELMDAIRSAISGREDEHVGS